MADKRGIKMTNDDSQKIRSKMKKQKYHTVEMVPKSNSKIIERGQIDTPTTHIHASSLSQLGTDTSIKSGGVKLGLWA